MPVTSGKYTGKKKGQSAEGLLDDPASDRPVVPSTSKSAMHQQRRIDIKLDDDSFNK